MLGVFGIKDLGLFPNWCTSDMGSNKLFDGGINGGFDDATQLGANPSPSRSLYCANIFSILGEVVNVI